MKKLKLEQDLHANIFARFDALEAILGETLYEIGILGGETSRSRTRAEQFFDRAFDRMRRNVQSEKSNPDSDKTVKRVTKFLRGVFEETVQYLERDE
ncbi:MAG: hypothetical protein RO009_04190 [Pseudorhodoplanes sp.]|jgi:hypothetical protein|nr:hypothetical protein [Pseudorhodoplanes sp.]